MLAALVLQFYFVVTRTRRVTHIPLMRGVLLHRQVEVLVYRHSRVEVVHVSGF